ncbi:MAG: hypothetical protein M5U07_15765 [Xanthobacteraceae bacterium]|nr:hypothetical protein [Xanthobacteraceae bacterium]
MEERSLDGWGDDSNGDSMHGPDIFVRSNSVPTTGGPSGKPFKYGNAWQYHPRSDRHSKIACWSVMFDLLRDCPLLRKHIVDGKVAFGINHPMRDFAQNREKNLDLVICRAFKTGAKKIGRRGISNFREMVDPYTVVLTPKEKADLAALPNVPLAEPATVLVAIEAKACMTEFGKARPRLYDELNSSHLTIHGDTNNAVAAGLAMVNIASNFVSPTRNHWTLGTQPTEINHHDQPADAKSAIDKILQLKRRSRPSEEGFDAIGVLVVDCANDGSTIRLHRGPPAPRSTDFHHYEQFVSRLSHIYATRFTGL